MMESMPATEYLPLRILYSIDGCTQYILARSHILVPVIPYPNATPTAGAPRYGMVSYQVCIDTLTRSSPDLVNDVKDYSLYLMDPTESSPPGPSSSTAPPGVAVAFGLLSDAITSQETERWSANGTFTKLNTGHDAFEVVMSLKEVRPSSSPIFTC